MANAFEMEARFDSRCATCKSAIKKGSRILYNKDKKTAECQPCFSTGNLDFIDELVADEIATRDERYRSNQEWN